MATRTLLLRAGSPRDIDTVEAMMLQAFDPVFSIDIAIFGSSVGP